MKLHLAAAVALAAIMMGTACTALASYTKPKSYVVHQHASSVYGYSSQRLFLNSGPGTRSYFKELGSFGSKAGDRVHILAKAYDPNNAIWWIEVEYPTGSGNTGWTGYKRFDASSFNLNAVPTESWY